MPEAAFINSSYRVPDNKLDPLHYGDPAAWRLAIFSSSTIVFLALHYNTMGKGSITELDNEKQNRRRRCNFPRKHAPGPLSSIASVMITRMRWNFGEDSTFLLTLPLFLRVTLQL